MKVLVSYDNSVVPYTTGNYFLEAFGQVADAMHCRPWELKHVRPSDFDLFVKIDDGIEHHKWRQDLHPSVYYVIDSHIDTEKWREKTIVEGQFDHVFTAQKDGVDQYNGICQAKWVPLACDPASHRPRIGAQGKEYDVCFIGSLHSPYASTRADYLNRLFMEAPNFYFGKRAWQDMADKFYQSKIVFNHALKNDINMRYFEACCSGSFQLASRIHDNGFEEIFAEGEHMECYDSPDEMADKVNYYLKHDKEREKIARNGVELVNAFHTYRDRAQTILTMVGKATSVSV